MSVRLRKWTTKEGKSEEAWQVDFVFQHADGRKQRVVKFSPVQTRRGADAYERDLRNALLNGTFGKEKKPGEGSALTLAKFTPRFLTYSENNNKHSTVVSKRQILEDHVLPFFGEMALDVIGPAQIEDFKALMRKKQSAAHARKDNATKSAIRKRKGDGPKALSLKTLNNVLTVLSKLLDVAVEQHVIPQAPRVRLFGKVPKPTFDFLSFEEAERLINMAEPEWKTVLLVAIKTGLRQGELIGLQWPDVDLKRGLLHVRRAIWRGVTSVPKGGRERTIELPESVVAALKAHRHLRGPYVFCLEDGSPLSAPRMNRPLQRSMRHAGITREVGIIGWHDLRHTYGSHLVMRGIPLKVIQELMGHATIDMTERYAHLSPDTRRNAVRVLDLPLAPACDIGATRTEAVANHA
ncbi:site-specific integrase [Myxococcus llanfairpwllgwyngyllgogerychwyrndrobwllllantysiliogogogochensis]|uniref:Site-specific integrase n=1 Tax=Myxococcus llanfairpwllgwyngyllgogerychwyrndrobwllllantysiliogogogochensis TaxID=2590453 RepID=A0A540WXI4_9BACT|nr:site-specific integrase [Myxococcus llanfairpwllgwyngyllgogerychwyrndrobwllllantysiliogogogochensis]TQF13718.1 site-specific integrase [Myxococcus llanfairpwllgwyngyllgogerychwyrndrobwllllantysiliogogogochensis]